MVHCGSRGFGHQICSDYLRVMDSAVQEYKLVLPDRELVCAPGKSSEAQDYYQEMACVVNYVFVNRQTILHWVRQSFQQVFMEEARAQTHMSNKHNLVLHIDRELVEKTRNLGFNLSKTFEHHLKQLLTQFSQVNSSNNIGNNDNAYVWWA